MNRMNLSCSGSRRGYVALNHVLGRWMRFGEDGLEFGRSPNDEPVITFGIDEI